MQTIVVPREPFDKLPRNYEVVPSTRDNRLTTLLYAAC